MGVTNDQPVIVLIEYAGNWHAEVILHLWILKAADGLPHVRISRDRLLGPLGETCGIAAPHGRLVDDTQGEFLWQADNLCCRFR